jgi:hypothetical protein
MMRAALLAATVLTAAMLSAQPLTRGDVLVGTTETASNGAPLSRLLVYGRDGVFKRELSATTSLREPISAGTTLLVPSLSEIWRFDENGNRISDFSDIDRAVFIARALDGSIAGSNGSGELFVLTPDGQVRTFRSTVLLNEPVAHGVDLGPDQCSVYFQTGANVAVWDACANTTPRQLGPARSSATGRAVRILADGTFLTTYLTDVVHVDASGSVIHTYAVPGRGLALDIDGTSFWTSAQSTLVHVDIATGAILQTVNTPQAINYLGVVGEPRAALAGTNVPVLSTLGLLLLLAALVVVGLLAAP